VGLPDVPLVRFEAGDVLVLAHGDPYWMLSAPDQAPEFDTQGTLQFFRDIAAGKLPFVIKEGGGGAQRAQFVCGYLGCDMQPFNPLLAALPRLLKVKAATGRQEGLLNRLIELTLTEAQTHRLGGDSIRLGLCELMFVELIRGHLEMLPADQTGWLSGLRDSAISRVLCMMHERPSHAWTLQELADEAGLSRAVLAGRFSQLVGCPPMQYLMLWRMQIAARLLGDTAMKVAAIAHEVGYESEAAFSRVFKRVTGLSPGSWRTRHEATTPLQPRW
jgi:AraC-like DNA-binding protein